VALLDARDNAPGVDFQRSIELDSAVSLIVMGAPLYLAGAHRQQGLPPIEGLNLGLLIDAENHGVLRWVEI